MKRPDLGNYKGDGSTMDYMNDMDEYCDMLVRKVEELEDERHSLIDELNIMSDEVRMANQYIESNLNS